MMSGILASLGIGFDSTKLKVKLKMAVSRISMNLNRLNNQLLVDRKSVSVLLSEQRDESARIRVEGIIHQRNLVNVLEILSLMCELLSTRIALLTAQAECSTDLLESIASIIYCSKRLDTVPELNECTDQFNKKYGQKFVLNHINNQSQQVNPRIVRLLSVEPPSFEVVLEQMQQIADQYDVAWKPNLATDVSSTPDNIYALGSIVRNTQSNNTQHNTNNNTTTNTTLSAAPMSITQPTVTPLDKLLSSLPHYSTLYKQPTAVNMYPGTLTLYIHAAQQVQLQSALYAAGIVVRVQNCVTEQEFRSDARFGDNDQFYIWPHASAVFDVNSPTDKILIELRAVAGDTLIGSNVINVETLRCSVEHTWYETHRADRTDSSANTGSILISSEYTPVLNNHTQSSATSNNTSNSMSATHNNSMLDLAPPTYDQHITAADTNTSHDSIMERLNKLR